MKIYLKAIKENSMNRPAGYEDEILSNGKINGEFLDIQPNKYSELLRKYGDTQQPVIKKTSCCSKGPGLIEKAKNLSQAVVQVVKSVSQGNPLNVSDEISKQRMAICEKCEFFNSLNKSCRRCGCNLPAKTKLTAMYCPLKKW